MVKKGSKEVKQKDYSWIIFLIIGIAIGWFVDNTQIAIAYILILVAFWGIYYLEKEVNRLKNG